MNDDARRDRRERARIWFFGSLTCAVIVLWMAWSMTADRRAIARLPAEQRRVVYEHTLTSIRTMCTSLDDPAIRRRCREQAEFLTTFPECDAECQKLVA